MTRRRRFVLGTLLALTALAAVLYWQFWSAPHFGEPLETGNKEDARRKKLLGVWQDEYMGKRTMTLNDDGSATLVYEPKSGLFKLRFDMRWQLDGDLLKKQSLGGEPEFMVNPILKAQGTKKEYTILELTDDRLHLEDLSDKAKYDWKRVRQ